MEQLICVLSSNTASIPFSAGIQKKLKQITIVWVMKVVEKNLHWLPRNGLKIYLKDGQTFLLKPNLQNMNVVLTWNSFENMLFNYATHICPLQYFIGVRESNVHSVFQPTSMCHGILWFVLWFQWWMNLLFLQYILTICILLLHIWVSVQLTIRYFLTYGSGLTFCMVFVPFDSFLRVGFVFGRQETNKKVKHCLTAYVLFM